MTTLSVNLSTDDEKILSDIIKTQKNVTTLEEALLWCLREFVKLDEAFSEMKYERSVPDQVDYVDFSELLSSAPGVGTRPTPTNIEARLILISGPSDRINNWISKLPGDFS